MEKCTAVVPAPAPSARGQRFIIIPRTAMNVCGFEALMNITIEGEVNHRFATDADLKRNPPYKMAPSWYRQIVSEPVMLSKENWKAEAREALEKGLENAEKYDHCKHPKNALDSPIPAPSPFMNLVLQSLVYGTAGHIASKIPSPAPVWTAKDLMLYAYPQYSGEPDDGTHPELNPAQKRFMQAFKQAKWEHARFVEVVRRLPYQDDRIDYMEDVVAGKADRDSLYPDEAVLVYRMAPHYTSPRAFASAIYDLTLTDPKHWKAAGHDFPAPAKFDRCVEDVKAKGKATNPYAVCHAALKADGQ